MERLSHLFYGSDDEGFYVGGGGKEARKEYFRELAKSGIGAYEKWPDEYCDWNKKDKRNEAARHADATYTPAELDDGELSSLPRNSPGRNLDRLFEMTVEIIGNRISDKLVMKTFEQGFYQMPILRNLGSVGYKDPLPIQQCAIPYIQNLRDVIALSPTGSGKTASYILPILDYIWKRGDSDWIRSSHPAPCAIIVVPTHELAEQVKNEGRKLSSGTKVQIISVYGRTNWRSTVECIRRHGCNILVGTPGRILQLLSEGRLHLGKCKYIVLDEPTCILNSSSSEGYIEQILDFPGLPDRGHIRNTLIFSATFPKQLQELANRYLYDFVVVSVGKIGVANTDIVQTILRVPNCEKIEKICEIINENSAAASGKGNGNKTIVFVGKGKVAGYVASRLSAVGVKLATIHGGLEQREREEALQKFNSGRCSVLVATGVASRGLDAVGVDHVVNFDLPFTIDEYIHRIGRTGRVGNSGRATSFYEPRIDGTMAAPLLQVLRDAKQDIPDWLVKEEREQSPNKHAGRGDE